MVYWKFYMRATTLNIFRDFVLMDTKKPVNLPQGRILQAH